MLYLPRRCTQSCWIHVIYFQPYIYFSSVHLAICLLPKPQYCKLFLMPIDLNFLIGIYLRSKSFLPELTTYPIYLFFMFANTPQFWDTNFLSFSNCSDFHVVKTLVPLSPCVPKSTRFLLNKWMDTEILPLQYVILHCTIFINHSSTNFYNMCTYF